VSPSEMPTTLPINVFDCTKAQNKKMIVRKKMDCFMSKIN
jgi:hypothetical protein